MRISDWSSDVCSSDLLGQPQPGTVLYADDTLRGFGVRLAYTWIDLHIPQTQPALLVVAETMEKRTELANDIIKRVIIPQFVVLPVAVLLVWFGLSRGVAPLNALQRSEERRLGNECVRTFSSRWSRFQ